MAGSIKRARRESFLQQNRFMLAFLLLVLTGIIGGVWIVLAGTESPFMSSNMAGGFLIGQEFDQFFAMVGSCFLRSTFWLLVIFLLGFSAVASPILWLVPAFKGLGMGYVMGCLFLLKQWDGVPAALLRIVLPGLLTVYVLALGCQEALRQARALRECFTATAEDPVPQPGLRGYLIRFVVYLVLLAVCALAESGTSVAAGLML